MLPALLVASDESCNSSSMTYLSDAFSSTVSVLLSWTGIGNSDSSICISISGTDSFLIALGIGVGDGGSGWDLDFLDPDAFREFLLFMN